MKISQRIVYRLKSLSFQAGIFAFVFVLVPVLIMLSVFYNNIEGREVTSLSSNVTSQAQLIGSRIVSGGYMSAETGESIQSRFNYVRDMLAGRVMIMDRSMKILIDTYDIYEGRILIWENALRSLAGESISEYDEKNNLLTISIPIGASEDILEGNIQGVVMITRTTDYIDQDKAFFGRIAGIIAIVAVFLAGLAAFVVSRLVGAAIGKLRDDMNELADGKRLLLDGSDKREIDEISDSINRFSEKLRQVDDQLKEFVSNVSHELKTPLTSMKILADSINSGEDVPIDFYKEFMGDITKEIDRESAIIDDLLKLVRTENESATLDLESINLNELMEEILKKLSPIAENAGVEMVLETFKPVPVTIDRVKLSQAMINLVENAIKYNREEGGFVHVSVNSDASYAFIRVEDNGIGIPEEDKELIFERFFRVDKSHSKEIDGTGLGLAIVKNIITLHKGEIRVESIEGMGTTFIIRIPLFVEGVK